MAASDAAIRDEAEPTPLEPETESRRPAVYRVARSTPEKQALNTIDIYGEKPFSV
jgi:hypothetical protein